MASLCTLFYEILHQMLQAMSRDFVMRFWTLCGFVQNAEREIEREQDERERDRERQREGERDVNGHRTVIKGVLERFTQSQAATFIKVKTTN